MTINILLFSAKYNQYFLIDYILKCYIYIFDNNSFLLYK